MRNGLDDAKISKIRLRSEIGYHLMTSNGAGLPCSCSDFAAILVYVRTQKNPSHGTLMVISLLLLQSLELVPVFFCLSVFVAT